VMVRGDNQSRGSPIECMHGSSMLM
jgi:hypothetical protein